MPNPQERPARNACEQALRDLIDRYTIHRTLHALVEACYRKSAEGERSHPRGHQAGNWRELARELTAIEAQAAHMDL